jgi:hypothetical protein
MFYEAIQYFVLRLDADTDMDFQRRKQNFQKYLWMRHIINIGT